MKLGTVFVLVGALASASSFAEPVAHDVQAGGPLLVRQARAEVVGDVSKIEMFAAARAGQRLVAVGERGVVALSDDGGRSWRQARSVPIQASLTAVHFIDAKTGWAVGHWGVILNTEDGGETWGLQHSRPDIDQPLFSVYFKNAQDGWAVGLWSLYMVTHDGGATWTASKIAPSGGAAGGDFNLYSITRNSSGRLMITGERGLVLSSEDEGEKWNALNVGYEGSLWIGRFLRSGDWVVGGLRGSIYCSHDQGATWTRSETGTTSSITGIEQLPDGHIVASALDGVSLSSTGSCAAFKAQQRPDRNAFTAVIAGTDGRLLFFSKAGIVAEGAKSPGPP